MCDPAKVLNFLDFAAIPAGTWDPSLAFVMAGGIAVASVGFRFVFKRSKPILGETFHLPSANGLDAALFSAAISVWVGASLAFAHGPAFHRTWRRTTARLVLWPPC
jgi:hypothetical protein